MFTSDPRLYFNDLYLNTSDLIQYVSLDGSIQAVNRCWLKRLEYPGEPVTDKSIYDFIIEEDRERYRTYRRQVVSGENVEGIEFQFISRTGKLIPVEGICGRSSKTTRLSIRGEFSAISPIERKRKHP